MKFLIKIVSIQQAFKRQIEQAAGTYRMDYCRGHGLKAKKTMVNKDTKTEAFTYTQLQKQLAARGKLLLMLIMLH